MKLSIITVNYNDKVGLNNTVQSVINQTFDDYEYIIIDGGSTDGSVDVIKQFEKGITYWVSEKDNGIYNAMNKAIDVAKGEYCIFMNSGDVFNNLNTLEELFAYNPQEDIVCGNTCTVNGVVHAPNEITLAYLFSNCICHQCAFIKTSLMAKYKYDEKYKIVSDRKFFLQALICDNCTYKSINVDVVNYDINGYSAKQPLKSRMEFDMLLEELFPPRIRMDYGSFTKGSLYGDTNYDKLFVEIRLRRYRRLVYFSTLILLRIISVFLPSAKFAKEFPFCDK